MWNFVRPIIICSLALALVGVGAVYADEQKAPEQPPVEKKADDQKAPEQPAPAEKKADGNAIKASYKGGFKLETENGKFSLRLFSALQGRYTYMDYDDNIKGNEENYSNFYIRRARIWWDGHAYSPDFTYYFHLQLEPSSAVNLHDAWVQYKFSPMFALGLGRNKIPYGTEFLASGFGLNFVERSVMYGETDINAGGGYSKYPGGGNEGFPLSGEDANTGFPTGGLCLFRSQGVSATGMKGGDDEPTFQYEAGIWQGRNTKGASNPDDNHLYAVRLGYYPMGWINWLFQGDPDNLQKLKIGFLLSAYTDSNTRNKDAAGATVPLYETNDSGYNVSVLLKYRGFSTDVEWGTETYEMDREMTGPNEFDREGWRVAFGYFVKPSKVEIVARYAQIERLQDPTAEAVTNSGMGFVNVWNGDAYVAAIEKQISEITAGVNFYYGKHQHKLFFDLSQLTREFAEYQGYTPDDQEDIRFRTMLQFKF